MRGWIFGGWLHFVCRRYLNSCIDTISIGLEVVSGHDGGKVDGLSRSVVGEGIIDISLTGLGLSFYSLAFLLFLDWLFFWLLFYAGFSLRFLVVFILVFEGDFAHFLFTVFSFFFYF